MQACIRLLEGFASCLALNFKASGDCVKKRTLSKCKTIGNQNTPTCILYNIILIIHKTIKNKNIM